MDHSFNRNPVIAVEFTLSLPEPIGWLPSDCLCGYVGASPWVFEVLPWCPSAVARGPPFFCAELMTLHVP